MLDAVFNYFLPNDPLDIPWGTILTICVVLSFGSAWADSCTCETHRDPSPDKEMT